MTEADRARPRRPHTKTLDLRAQSLAVDLILREGLSMEEAVARAMAKLSGGNGNAAADADAPPRRLA